MTQNFTQGTWSDAIDVRDFIQKNYTPYTGDDRFLVGKSPKTENVWDKAKSLIEEEIEKGIIGIDTTVFSGINNYKPGYLSKENEVIVGFQTDEPLKRIMNPYGGFRMLEASLEAYNYDICDDMSKDFQTYRKTHNEGVFDAYTTEMKTARSVGLLTGLPDAYGRGRIIGDYRRIALYGTDRLIAEKKKDFKALEAKPATEQVIRLREELSMQIRALKEIAEMAISYGDDITKPATTAKEAIQFFYYGYLSAVKENNGAAMSLGRNTTFLDIYIERDLRAGLITEAEAQELIDQLVIKLRMVRHLRTPDYNTLFAGDPTWVTESIGGMGTDGRTLVTKTAFRFLHTLINLDPAPEPNMTVLWSRALPENFKRFCAKMSIDTGAIQYENDDLMRPIYGDDYGIACCVSPMRIGKDMQFFGARANLGKALLYSMNEGREELKRQKDGQPMVILQDIHALTSVDPDGRESLSYDEVMPAFKRVMDKLAGLYVNTMNTIHFMHDKYAYESGQMALHDSEVRRYIAFGIAGLSIVADSLSAIKYAKVRPVRDEHGIAMDFVIEGDFPAFGNDDDRVDTIATEVVTYFSDQLKKHETYRNSEQTLSVLTITSNVVYGKKTGATPDGRGKGEPFAPGANPMHGRDKLGALASLNSVSKLPFENVCQDGISNTFSIVPAALGRTEGDRLTNLAGLLDGYFAKGAFHLNVNVMSRALLIDAMENPSKYPTLTIRVSGYAVHFNRLTREQKEEVIMRTFHERV
ncbi:formate C-acetyltransferase [Acidaminobacter sp.]|uniref:formate C-acetyltransferase n=1 Tax=Acidaminobacter sp. TaxID=1872102 RepID=UPI001380321F|nr:formate C-acetyltransferase [Acidaminobacter sp.]MDK9711733.1 formate C-acetyltransferase [Acidaminobacter sp.]MZQ97525.1 formate C-acetyltransferase [Acidaminobacter sp.]